MLTGALEARESARQIAELAGPLRVTTSGAGLTALGFAASTVVYLVLGWRAGGDSHALRMGAVVGIAAGLIGGAVRALEVRDVLGDAIARYATVPEWFVWGALGVFVIGSVMVSAVGGAAIAFAGVRIRRASSRSSATSEP